MSQTIGRKRRQRRVTAAALVLTLGSALFAGCSGGGELTGTLGTQGLTLNGGTRGTIVPALVGQWFRLVYVPDSAGSVRTSETTLDLRSDGTLVRTVVSRLLSFNFADQVVSTGTWRATATTLTLTITTAGTTGTPVDSATTSSGLPALLPNPPFGTTPSTTTSADSVGTSNGTTTYAYRIETTSQGSTLFINETPFVRLVNTQ